MGTCTQWSAHARDARDGRPGAHLCQAREVDQRQVQDIGRVNLEVDGLSDDALVVAGDPGGLVLDLSLDVGKIVESSVRNVVELCPLGASRDSRRSIGVEGRIWRVIVFGNVDELEDQRPPGADAAASGQKVAADDVFENGGFASGLGSDNNLRGA